MKKSRPNEISIENFEEIIFLRLQGDHANEPYEITRGEMPEQWLIDFYNKIGSSKRRRFETAFIAIGKKVLLNLQKIMSDKRVMAQPWLIRFFTLCSEFQFPALESTVNQAVGCLMQSKIALNHLKLSLAIFEASLSKQFISTSAGDTIAVRWARGRISDTVLYQIGMIFVGQAPSLFRNYLDLFVPRLVKSSDVNAQGHFRDLIHELVGNTPKNEYFDLMYKFQNLVGKTSWSRHSSKLRSIFIDVLSQTKIPVESFIEVEWSYWRSRQRESRKYPEVPPSFRSVMPTVRGHSKMGSEVPTRIKMNQTPFAEATLIRILQFAGQAAVMPPFIDLAELSSWETRDVARALRDKDVDVLFYNASILRECETDEFIQSKALLAWTGYEAIVSTEYLATLLVKYKDRHDFISNLYEGRDYLSEAEINGNKDIVAYIFQNARIATCEKADIGQRLMQFCKQARIGIPRNIENVNDNDGLRLILNGKAHVYFGGAIQAEYARHSYRHRVRPFLRIANELTDSTKCYFWCRSEFDKKYPQLLNTLKALWDLVPWIWDQLLKEHQHEDHQRFISELKEYLLVEINQNSKHDKVQGFVDTFERLAQIINTHNTLDPQEVDSANDGVIKLNFSPSHEEPERSIISIT